MAEHRDKTTTEGRGLGFSFAADNVVRGEPGADFEKRRPTYPLGDDPTGREIDFGDTTGNSSYGSTRNQVFRAYRGSWPLEGQTFEAPSRSTQLQKPQDLRPESPPRSVATAALDVQKELDRAQLIATDFAAIFPATSISAPAPGAILSPGQTVTISAPSSHLTRLMSATLFIDGQPTLRRALSPGDQGVAKAFTFNFLYDIPVSRVLGPMDITVRVFAITNSAQGIIADDALNVPPLGRDITGAVGTLDGRKGQSTSSILASPRLAESGFLRAPTVSATITVNIV